MNRKQQLTSLAKEANIIYEKAYEDGITDSDFYATIKDTLGGIIKSPKEGLVNMNSIRRISSSSKTRQLIMTLSRFNKSSRNNLEGVTRIREKQIKSLQDNWKGMTRKKAVNFINIMDSDIFEKITENLSYISYNDMLSNVINSNINVHKLEKAFSSYESTLDAYEKADSKLTEMEKSQLFINILTKRG